MIKKLKSDTSLTTFSPQMKNVTPKNSMPFRSYAAPVLTMSPRGEMPKTMREAYKDERTDNILYLAKKRVPFVNGRKAY